jgi:hypothetical protein
MAERKTSTMANGTGAPRGGKNSRRYRTEASALEAWEVLRRRRRDPNTSPSELEQIAREEEQVAEALADLKRQREQADAPRARRRQMVIDEAGLLGDLDALRKRVAEAAIRHREPSLAALHDVLNAGLYAFVANATDLDTKGLGDLYAPALAFMKQHAGVHIGGPVLSLNAMPFSFLGSDRDEALFLVDEVALPIMQSLSERLVGEAAFYLKAGEALASELFSALSRGMPHLWSRVVPGPADLGQSAKQRAVLDIQSQLASSGDDPDRWTKTMGEGALPPLVVASALRAMGVPTKPADDLTRRKLPFRESAILRNVPENRRAPERSENRPFFGAFRRETTFRKSVVRCREEPRFPSTC